MTCASTDADDDVDADSNLDYDDYDDEDIKEDFNGDESDLYQNSRRDDGDDVTWPCVDGTTCKNGSSYETLPDRFMEFGFPNTGTVYLFRRIIKVVAWRVKEGKKERGRYTGVNKAIYIRRADNAIVLN